jgi:hypothetical protein
MNPFIRILGPHYVVCCVCQFLAGMKIMDYSLLVGIHSITHKATRGFHRASVYVRGSTAGAPSMIEDDNEEVSPAWAAAAGPGTNTAVTNPARMQRGLATGTHSLRGVRSWSCWCLILASCSMSLSLSTGAVRFASPFMCSVSSI